VVHINARSLEGRLEDGTGISAQTCQRLCCDAGIVPMLEDEAGVTLDIGRKSRSVPAGMRRALRHRDGGCRFPGCTNTRFTDAHHIEPWDHGGDTALENLIELCRRHHRFVHEYGYAIRREHDAIWFVDPAGHAIPQTGERPYLFTSGVDRIAAALQLEGIELDPETNRPDWDGSTPDYGRCIGSLFAVAA